MPVADFSAEGSEEVVAWICFNCFDQRFDLALGAFQNLEKALIAIEEKTGRPVRPLQALFRRDSHSSPNRWSSPIGFVARLQ